MQRVVCKLRHIAHRSDRALDHSYASGRFAVSRIMRGLQLRVQAVYVQRFRFPSPGESSEGALFRRVSSFFFLFTTTNGARKRPRIPKSVAGHLSAKSAIGNNACVGNICAVSLDKLHAIQIRVTRRYGRGSLFTVKERFAFNHSIKHRYRKREARFF